MKSPYVELSKTHRSRTPYGDMLPTEKLQEWEQERTLLFVCRLSEILVEKKVITEKELDILLDAAQWGDKAGPVLKR